jgi:cell division protein FtsL
MDRLIRYLEKLHKEEKQLVVALVGFVILLIISIIYFIEEIA